MSGNEVTADSLLVNYINGIPAETFGANTTQLVDVPINTAPSSTSITAAATANSLTNSYNKLFSVIPQLVDVPINTAPSSTSMTAAATAKSLTNAYNKAVASIPTLIDLATSTAPTSTSTTSAATANSLTNAYNTISTTLIPSAANIGTTAAGTVTVGSTSQVLTLQGHPTGTHNILTNLTSGTINICTNTPVNPFTINIGPILNTSGTVNIYRVSNLLRRRRNTYTTFQ